MYASSLTFLATFVIAYFRNPDRTAPFLELGAALVLVPLIPALLHWRIRMEREKGRNAIIEKYREVSGGRS